MAGDDRVPAVGTERNGGASRNVPKEPIEERLLARLRLISVIVILVCIFLTAVIDPLGRLFIDPSFHASEVILGTLIGALVILLGIEGVRRLPGMPK